MVICPDCQGVGEKLAHNHDGTVAGKLCELCEGQGEVSELDAMLPRAALSARRSKAKFTKPRAQSPDELLSDAFKPEASKRWNCEDEIKPMLTAFSEEWPECVPSGSKSSLYASARKVIAEVGEAKSAEFIHWASQEVKRKSPDVAVNVKDLRSLMFKVPAWRRMHRDHCPECGQHWTSCPHEWGSNRREEKYGGLF
jgi:hypothetical protein